MTNKEDELSSALIESTNVIGSQARTISAQSEEILKLQDQSKVLEDRISKLNQVRYDLEEKTNDLSKTIRSLRAGHLATSKAVRQNAVAYLNESGDIVAIGLDSFRKVSYINGRDRLISDSWQPLGIIPKITEEEV